MSYYYYNSTQFMQYGQHLVYAKKIKDRFGSSVSLSLDSQIIAFGTPCSPVHLDW